MTISIKAKLNKPVLGIAMAKFYLIVIILSCFFVMNKKQLYGNIVGGLLRFLKSPD